MKIPIEVTDYIIEDFVRAELGELRDVIQGDSWWDTDDKERDLAAIDLVLSWYNGGN
jgi:hypothetical protein